MAVEGVDEPSLQQVQDLDRAVAGAADQEVVGRVDGEAVDGGAVNCTTYEGKKNKVRSHGLIFSGNIFQTTSKKAVFQNLCSAE